MTNITIDGKKYEVKDGITVIEAIDQINSDLPRYCYHPGLSIAGNCRICQVEIEKMPRTAIACNTRVAEGMVIHTSSAKAKESQQRVLEFLLANHPLDCPVCDQAGECKLQDYYMEYGLYDAKFNEFKVKKSKKAQSIGPNIMLDQERCILCSRCVRFADEVTKTHDFGIFNRGDHAQLDVYPGKQLDNKYSGNVADICPVGALTDKDFRFKLRVWYLGSQDSVCPGCSRGCNIKVEYERSRPYPLKGARVMRLKPRENAEVNKWWICDEGRYNYKFIDEHRILEVKAPGLSKPADMNGQWDNLAWNSALAKAALQLSNGRWALVASGQYTNEELYLMKKLFTNALKWKDIAFRAPNEAGTEDDFLIKKDKNPNTAGALEILGLDERSSDLSGIFEKAKKGELDGLFIFRHDLSQAFGLDAWNAVRAKVKTVIYDGWTANVTAATADIVLPSAVYAEKDGTFTNFEGRVQRIRKAVEPLGQSRPTWQILSELLRLQGAGAFSSAEAVFDELSSKHEAFRNLSYKKIGSHGALWNKK